MNQMTGSEDMLMRARYFATAAHAAVGQVRKYTNEPYINHPAEVVRLLESVGADSVTRQGGWLHDVVEDTKVPLVIIGVLFGEKVMGLVAEVTDVSKPEDGNRVDRKAKDLAHLAGSSPEGATIKLADLISNTSSIVAHDPAFAKVYLQEKEALLEVLGHGNPVLLSKAKEVLAAAKLKLQENEGK